MSLEMSRDRMSYIGQKFYLLFNARSSAVDSALQFFLVWVRIINRKPLRKRQAAITAEICEISSAANAIAQLEAKSIAGPGLGVMDNEVGAEGPEGPEGKGQGDWWSL